MPNVSMIIFRRITTKTKIDLTETTVISCCYAQLLREVQRKSKTDLPNASVRQNLLPENTLEVDDWSRISKIRKVVYKKKKST